MIVPSMSPIEMHKAFYKDFEKLNYQISKNTNKAKKVLQKSNYCSEKWDSRDTGTNYTIIFFRFDESEIGFDKAIFTQVNYNNTKYYVSFGVFPYFVEENNENIAARSLFFFRVHFLERYRERVLKNDNLQLGDVLAEFLFRTKRINKLDLNNDILRDFKEKYGKFASVALVNDGICLLDYFMYGNESTIGEKDSNFVSIALYQTFVSNDMLSDVQKKAIKEEELKYAKNYYYSLFEQMRRGLSASTFSRWKAQ